MGTATRFKLSYRDVDGEVADPEGLGELALPQALEAVSRWMTQAAGDLDRLNAAHPETPVAVSICVGVIRGQA